LLLLQSKAGSDLLIHCPVLSIDCGKPTQEIAIDERLGQKLCGRQVLR
jgi:hypothetical protein